jgi:hypothetical protein
MQLVFTIFPKVIDVQTNVRYNQVISKKTEVSIHVTICVGILFLKKDGSITVCFSFCNDFSVFNIYVLIRFPPNSLLGFNPNTLAIFLSEAGSLISSPLTDAVNTFMVILE